MYSKSVQPGPLIRQRDSHAIETTIFMPTKNGDEWMKECLEAVYSQEGVGPVEIVIGDSRSIDKMRLVL